MRNLKEQIIKNGWHPDYAETIKNIFDKYSDNPPLIVEKLYELFREVHKDVI